MSRGIGACGRDRTPHIGEYDTKTNAICGFSQARPTPHRGGK